MAMLQQHAHSALKKKKKKKNDSAVTWESSNTASQPSHLLPACVWHHDRNRAALRQYPHHRSYLFLAKHQTSGRLQDSHGRTGTSEITWSSSYKSCSSIHKAWNAYLSQLVSYWCFKPSQPQGITSGLSMLQLKVRLENFGKTGFKRKKKLAGCYMQLNSGLCLRQ